MIFKKLTKVPNLQLLKIRKVHTPLNLTLTLTQGQGQKVMLGRLLDTHKMVMSRVVQPRQSFQSLHLSTLSNSNSSSNSTAPGYSERPNSRINYVARPLTLLGRPSPIADLFRRFMSIGGFSSGQRRDERRKSENDLDAKFLGYGTVGILAFGGIYFVWKRFFNQSSQIPRISDPKMMVVTWDEKLNKELTQLDGQAMEKSVSTLLDFVALTPLSTRTEELMNSALKTAGVSDINDEDNVINAFEALADEPLLLLQECLELLTLARRDYENGRKKVIEFTALCKDFAASRNPLINTWKKLAAAKELDKKRSPALIPVLEREKSEQALEQLARSHITLSKHVVHGAAVLDQETRELRRLFRRAIMQLEKLERII